MTVLTADVPGTTLFLDVGDYPGAGFEVFLWDSIQLGNERTGKTFYLRGSDFGFDQSTGSFTGDVTEFVVASVSDPIVSLYDFHVPLKTFFGWLDDGDGTDLIAALTTGNDTFNGSWGDDTLGAYAGDDLISGGGGADRLIGGRGKDLLDGGDGNDVVLGGGAGDRLVGGAGDDSIWGGKRDDVIIGGAGKDRLFGGTGADIFVFTDVTDSQAGRDVIVDFNGADGDRIDLSALGSLSFGGNRFDGIAGEVAVRASAGGDWVVMVDMDGDRSADLQIRVGSPVELGAGDFILSAS